MRNQAKTTASRLDPEAMPRRDFLGLAARWAAASALLFAFIGSIRLPRAAVLPSPSKKFRVRLPSALAPGEPYIPAGRSVALYKVGDKVYALSTVCTHLGCIVKPTPSGFDCPCHGSIFAKDGSVLKGPAPTALPWHEVQSLGGDEFFVDEGKIVAAGTMVSV